MLEEYEEAFKFAQSYRKKVIVEARKATQKEQISTSQDGTENYAETGDRIIHNPGDKDPYVFGDKADDISTRQRKFEKKYDPIPGQNGKFRAKGIIKAVQIFENIIFSTPWGETMAVKKGGWVADGGYGIAEESFVNTYEEFDPNKENEKAANQIKKQL